MKIPNKFNGYSRDGVRLYNGPLAPAALAGTTAIGTGVGGAAVGAGLGSLGTGLAAGATMAGGAGLLGKLGLSTIGTGLGGAGGVLGGTALTPAVASLAPAATAQVMGPSMLQSAGLEALKGKVIGGGVQQAATQQASNLAFQQAAAQNMAGGLANPMSQMGAKFLANSPPLAKPFGAETLLADTSNKILPQSLANAQGQIGGTVSTPWGGVQSYQYGNFPAGSPLHAGNITPTVTNTAAPTELLTTPSRFSEAGFRGLNPNYQSGLRPAANLVDDAGMAVADPRAEILGRGIRPNQNFLQNLGNIGSFQDAKDYAEQHPYATAGIAGLGAMGVKKLFEQEGVKEPESNAMIRPYTYDRSQRPEAYAVSPTQDSSERLYFNDQFIAGEPYKVAGGGIVSLAAGGPVEQMSAMNAIGANTGYPMANINSPMYSNPMMQRPEATNVIAPSADAGVGAYSGEQRFAAGGGISHLGDYSDGGRLLKGPGDGVSDSIPASIGGRQPARLADGEFVVPARIVSELGNGSTEAGARKLYAMMDRIQKGRRKSVGKGKVAVNSKSDKYLPA
jgi:hypothetical protein